MGTGSQFKDFGNVVVLGDSFSAGDGAFQALADYTDPDCRRSGLSYGEVLFPGKVTNLACTGAVRGNLTTSAQNGEEPQLTQLRTLLRDGERFDAVFLTIGGNDVGFADIATNCVLHNVLAGGSYGFAALPFLNPCAADPDSVLYGINSDLVDAQKPLQQDIYEQVALTFSKEGLDVPPIIVSPYALMEPNDVDLRWQCGTIGFAVNLDQLGYFRDFQSRLNAMIRQAVEDTRRIDGIPVYYAAEVESAMQPDHTLCSSQSWVVKPNPMNISVPLVGPSHFDTPFHPNLAGHEQWAIALARWSEQPGLELERGTKPLGVRTLPWVFTLAPRTTIDANNSVNVTTAGDVDLKMSGLTPGSTVMAVVYSSPYALGTATADEHGDALISTYLDATMLPPGVHTLTIGYTDAAGVTQTRDSTLYLTRPLPYALWAVLTLGLTSLAAGLIWRRRMPSNLTQATT